MDKSLGYRDGSGVNRPQVDDSNNFKKDISAKKISKPSEQVKPSLLDKNQAQQISKKPSQIGKKMVPDQPRTAAMPRPGVNEQAAKEAFLKSNSKILKSLDEKDEDSPFEKALKKALTGKKGVDSLAQGEIAKFKGKTKEGWKVFFKNLLKRSSKEKKQIYQRKQIEKSTFRGAYTENNQIVLVADFHFKSEYERMVDKFVRMYTLNPKLVETLKAIKPGSVIDDSILKTLGEEFEAKTVVHETLSYTDEEKKQMEKDLMTRLKRRVSVETRVRIEDQLIEARTHSRQSSLSKSQPIQPKLNIKSEQNDSFYSKKGFKIIMVFMALVGLIILAINL